MARKTYIPGAAEDVAKAAAYLQKYRQVILAWTALFAPEMLAATTAAIDAVIDAGNTMKYLHVQYDPWAYGHFMQIE